MVRSMSFAADLADALDDIRAEFSAAAIYRRGEKWIDVNESSKGKTAFRYQDSYGVQQRVETVDWLIATEVLDSFEEPRPGDRISETINGMTFIYEVCSINGELCWGWSDPGHTQRRVHTHLVDRVPL